MSATELAAKNKYRIYLLVAALLVSAILINVFLYFMNIDLADVAQEFGVTVGTMGQYATVGKLTGFFIALAMGFLSVRFNHKYLMLLGIAIYGIGNIGTYLSPNYLVFFAFEVLHGAGGGLITIMAYTLVGENLALKKRGWAVGLITSMTFAANIFISAPLTPLITDITGWRGFIIWVILPISVISLILSTLAIPSKPLQAKTAIRTNLVTKSDYVQAFRLVFKNKSAIGCILSELIWGSAVVVAYTATFYRIGFGLARGPFYMIGTAAQFVWMSSLFGFLGSFFAGAVINRWGRKPVTIISYFLSGIFIASFAYMPNAYLSAALLWASTIFVGFVFAGLTALALEQIPSQRGTMMSVYETFGRIGGFVGPFWAGTLLNVYLNNFALVFTISGILAIICGFIVLTLTKDPCKTLPFQEPQA